MDCSDESVFELGSLLEYPLLTRHLIAPTIFRLATTRRARQSGHRDIAVQLKQRVSGKLKDRVVRVTWSLADLALKHGESHVAEDLRKLSDSMNKDEITKLAAEGMCFILVNSFLPRVKITRVVQIGNRGDFYLNGRRDRMIEISGTVDGQLGSRFGRKRDQILLNRSLTHAWVSVTRFRDPQSRLERVK